MADEIIYTVRIEGQDRVINTFKELKQAKKDATDAAIRGDQDAIKSLGKLQEKLEDIKESAATTKGVGIEQLNSSIGILKDGLQNFDFDKIKVGFKGIGQAMSAAVPFLLIQAVQLLIEHFDELVTLFSSTAREAARIAKAYEDQKKKADELTQSINNKISIMEAELGLMKAQGKSSEQLLNQEIRLIEEKKRANEIAIKTLEIGSAIEKQKIREILNNDDIFESVLKLEVQALRKLGLDQKANEEEAKYDLLKLSRAEEFKNNIKKNEEEIAALRTKNTVLDINETTARVEFHNDIEKKSSDAFNEILSEQDDFGKEIDDRQKERDAAKLAGMKLLSDQEKQLRDGAVKEAQDNAKKDIDQQKQVAAVKLQIEQQTFAGIQNLSDFFFQDQINAAGGNKEKLAKIAEEQFNVNKALQIAQATITGIQSTFNAYTSTLAIPVAGPELAPFAAAAAGVFAASQIAKIAASKFNSAATTGSGSSGSAPSLPPPAPLPQIAAPRQVINQQPVNGQAPINITAQVVETQLTSTQALVNRLIRRSRF